MEETSSWATFWRLVAKSAPCTAHLLSGAVSIPKDTMDWFRLQKPAKESAALFSFRLLLRMHDALPIKHRFNSPEEWTLRVTFPSGVLSIWPHLQTILLRDHGLASIFPL